MPIEFQALTCSRCDGERFLPVLLLKHRPGGGLVEEKAGWQCCGCQQRFDAQAALRVQEVRAKRAELRQLEQELLPETPLEIEHAP